MNEEKHQKSKIKKLKEIDFEKIDPEEILRPSRNFPTREKFEYKSVYANKDKEVRGDVKAKFEKAISDFKKSPQSTYSKSRLKKENLSEQLQMKLENPNEEKKSLVEALKSELRIDTIIPFEPKCKRRENHGK